MNEAKKPSHWTGSPPVHRNILIIFECGEWFDRYSASLPIDHPPDAVIEKREHREYSDSLISYGTFRVWRSPEVPQKEWDKALMALTGVTTYEGKLLPDGLPVIANETMVEKHRERSAHFRKPGGSPRKSYDGDGFDDDWDDDDDE